MAQIAELLERYRRAPELLAAVLTGVKPEEEAYQPEPGKWSIRQIAAHLADGELVAGHRLRQVIAEDDPTLIAYNQDAWAARLGYAERKLKNAIETFRRLRAENYELLKSQPEAAYERAGNHTEAGRVTLAQLLEGCTRHAETHTRQIQEIRDRWKALRQRAHPL
ncbi:MAG: DinB family protein [Bryobacteraceae bacterium]